MTRRTGSAGIGNHFTHERRALHFAQPNPYEYQPLRERETNVLLQTIAAGNAAAAKLATGWDGPRRADLKRRVERGSRAKDTLASAFLWDAEWHARHCAAHCGGSVDDLRQEVLLGVLWAIETFDPDAGYRFDRHARIGMLRAVMRCLDGHARHA